MHNQQSTMIKTRLLLSLLLSIVVSTATATTFPDYVWYTPYSAQLDCVEIEPAVPVITHEDECVVNIPSLLAPDDPSNCRPMCIVCYEWCRLGDLEHVSPLFVVSETTGVAECDCYGGVVTTPAPSSALRPGATLLCWLMAIMLAVLLTGVSAGNDGQDLLTPIHPYAPSTVKLTPYWDELNQCNKAYNPPGCFGGPTP